MEILNNLDTIILNSPFTSLSNSQLDMEYLQLIMGMVQLPPSLHLLLLADMVVDYQIKIKLDMEHLPWRKAMLLMILTICLALEEVSAFILIWQNVINYFYF